MESDPFSTAYIILYCCQQCHSSILTIASGANFVQNVSNLFQQHEEIDAFL